MKMKQARESSEMRMGRHGTQRTLGAIALTALFACGPTPTTPTGPRPAPGAKPPSGASTAPSTAPGAGIPVTPAGSVAPAASATPSVIVTLAPIVPTASGAPVGAAVLAGQVSAPRALVLAAGGLISDHGAGIIANNGGGVLSNAGGNIIANNGGGLVSNNGGGYRLLALEQVPLEGVPITLVDGNGAPVMGPDGKPVTTVTDTEGRYAFAGVRPGRHLVVRAELPKVGALTRIVAPTVADAPLDFASTLATTYILDKFVATQADKQATLDRLPADVEAETVLIAGTAAANDAPPVSLVNAEIVARVDALRAKDSSLDAQMDKVKKLLIVAGVSNLGAGEIATEVALKPFKTIWPLADGRVYLQIPDDGMLWQLDLDGRLLAVAGRAAEGPGAAVSVGKAALVVDAAGRLLGGGEKKGAWRLTPGATPADLKVEHLGPDLPDVIAVCPLDGDAMLAFTWTPQGPAAAWRLAPGEPPQQIVSQPGSPPELAGVKRAARMPDGTIRLEMTPFMVPYVSRFEPASGQLTKIMGWASGMLDVAMAIDGTIYYTKPNADAVHTWNGGTDPIEPALTRKDLSLFNPFALAPGGGGAYFMAGGYSFSTKNATLNLRKAGATTHLAGLTAEASASGPGVVSLTMPNAFAVEADGDLLVADNGVLVRVTPGGAPTPVVPDGLAADGATFKARMPFAAPDGAILLVAQDNNESFINQRDAVFRIPASGPPAVVYRGIGGIGTAEQGPDGSLLLSDTRFEGFESITGQIERIAPDGTPSELVARGTAAASTKVWFDAGRPIFAKPRYEGNKTYYTPTRIEPDGTTVTLPEIEGAPLFTDAQGRTYTLGKSIARTDPKTGETVVLAGPGGRTFAGTGVDDGVGEARSPIFGPNGDLYFLDFTNRQIKRIPVDKQ